MVIDVLRSWKGRFLAPLLIAACLAAFPSASLADVVDDDPAAASNGPGNVSLAMRDSSGNLVTRAWTGSQWSPWSALTGLTLTSGPSIDIRPGPVTDVFARGPDNAIYHRYFTPGNGWSNWGSIGGCSTSAPASSWRGNGYLDVVIRGCDGAVWFTQWHASTGWQPWFSLGGGVIYHPAIKSYANGTISVYAVGNDHQLFQNYYNGYWSGWMPLGGYLTSGPSLSTQTESTIDVFARDANNNIAQRSWNGSSWSNWTWVTTAATSGPAAVAEGSGRVNLFVRGGGDLYMNQFFSGSWHGWTSQFPFNPNNNFYREQSSNAIFLVENGERFWVTSLEVAQAAELNLSTTEVVPNGSLNPIPRGEDITMGSLAWQEFSPDPGTATAAGSSWIFHAEDAISFKTTNAGAHVLGKVRWYHGRFPRGYRHRADFSGQYYALDQVGCLWIKANFGYKVIQSVSFPPNGSVAGAEKDSGYFVKCRIPNSPAPGSIGLEGIGFAKGLLESATLTICTSASKAEGPRYCANNKETYGFGR